MLCVNGLSCRLCGSLVSEIISNHSTALNDWRTSKAESVTPNQSSLVNTLYPFIKKRNSRTIIILSSKDECHVPSAADTGFFALEFGKCQPQCRNWQHRLIQQQCLMRSPTRLNITHVQWKLKKVKLQCTKLKDGLRLVTKEAKSPQNFSLVSELISVSWHNKFV